MSKILDALSKVRDEQPRPAARQQKAERQSRASRSLIDTSFQEVETDSQCLKEHRIINERIQPGAATAYKMLRTRLLHSVRTNGWNVIAVTSPSPDDGKTLTAANLAIAIALEGNHNVFLVDLDLRNPSVSEYIGATETGSILSYYQGEANIADIVYCPGPDNLFVIGNELAGVSNSSELISSHRTAELLGDLKQLDPKSILIFDLPPVLASDDVLAFSPFIDAVLFVVSEGRTTRENVSSSYELLSATNIEIAGVVLNRSTEGAKVDYY